MVKARTVKGITIGLLLFALVATAMLFPVSYARWQGGTNSLNATVQVRIPEQVSFPKPPAGFENSMTSENGAFKIELTDDGTGYFESKPFAVTDVPVSFHIFRAGKPVAYNPKDIPDFLEIEIVETAEGAYGIYTITKPGKYEMYVADGTFGIWSVK